MILLQVLGFIALMVVTTTWRGYVLSLLWGWFMVPAFGVPALSIPYAIGLSVICAMLARDMKKDPDQPEMAELIITALAAPLVFLAFGWVVRWFV